MEEFKVQWIDTCIRPKTPPFQFPAYFIAEGSAGCALYRFDSITTLLECEGCGKFATEQFIVEVAQGFFCEECLPYMTRCIEK